MPSLIDIAELNMMEAIAIRLSEQGLDLTAERLRQLIRDDLLPLSDLDRPKAATFGGARPSAAAIMRCMVEDCREDQRVLHNVAREFEPLDWRCPKHLPEGVGRMGLPHPAVRDEAVVDAWRNYFKREAKP